MTPLVAGPAVLVASTILPLAGIDDTAALHAAVSSLALGAVGWVYWRRERKRPRTERARAALQGGARNPWLVTGLFGLALLAVEFVYGFLFGLLVGASGVTEFDEFTELALGVMVLGLVTLTAVPLGAFAAHRLGSRTLLWLSGGVLISRFLSTGMGVVAGYFPLDLEVVVGILVATVIVLVGAALGYAWASHTSERFAVQQLFRALEPDDRRALLDLLRNETAQQTVAPS